MDRQSFQLTDIPLPQLPSTSLNIPWTELIKQAGNLIYFAWERFRRDGLYEVQEYESTLELLDTKGEKAVFHKRQEVRYLQDNIIAYQDQAWGDGHILLNYHCSPGQAVDRYRLGHKTILLISLREIKQRGDIDEFNIEWETKDTFLQRRESWETEISHRTRKAKIQVIYPRERQPQKAIFVEASRKVGKLAGNENRRQLPDGRWKVTWEIRRPRLNERYILRWEW